MFDIWIGDINLTVFILIVSFAIILPVQLWLCFKVKSWILRMAPMGILALSLIIYAILNLETTGWDGLLFILIIIYAFFMMCACGIGWAIWAIVSLIKRRKK